MLCNPGELLQLLPLLDCQYRLKSQTLLLKIILIGSSSKQTLLSYFPCLSATTHHVRLVFAVTKKDHIN